MNRRIDPLHVIQIRGIRLSTPALTALDLVPTLGGDAIDQVLRAKTAADLDRPDWMVRKVRQALGE